MNKLNSLLVLALFFATFSVGAKSPPPGTGKADVPANILILLDTSGSMSLCTNATTCSKVSLYYPFDVAIDSQGNVFVSEYRAHRIKKYDSSGTLLKTIGRWGKNNGQFRYPFHIDIDENDNIYVADYYNSRIQKLDNNGNWLKNFTGLSRPRGVTVDSSGNVYAGNHSTIRKWNSSGNYVTEWPSAYAYGLSAYGGSVYATNYLKKFYRYSASGTLQDTWSTSNSAYPYDIEVTSNGIYLANVRDTVQKYNSSGTYITQWGSYGTGDSNFRSVYGIGSDSSGNIHVADFRNHAIKKFDSNGVYINTLGRGNTRLDDAKKVIKKLVSSSDLTSGANFGLMEWGSSATMKVNISSQGASEIYQTIDQISAGGSTYLARAMNLAKRYFTGSNSPINKNASCQKNFLIVISDGSWWDNPDPVAKSLYNSLGVQTFVVGFHLGTTNTSTTANYISLAKAGSTYPDSPLYSDNWQHLSATLSNYIRQAISSRFTFSAPVVMPDISSGDHIFQSLFTYKKDHQWEGHLNKYKLNSDGTLGSLVWDAGKKLDSKAESSRQIWTMAEDEGITTSLNNFTTTDLTGLKNLIWENSGKEPADAEATDLINFVRGIDAYDEDADGSTTDKRWKMAEIYHSDLIVVGPPSESTNTTELKTEGYYRYTKNYSGFIGGQRCGGSCSQRKEVIYVGANDGMLHTFDSSTGEELWAFIPPTMLPKLRDVVSSKDNTSHSIFGIDGSPVVSDVYYDNRWRTILMAGMGRGGHGYFALDVTDPDQPSFLFAFSNRPTNQVIRHWATDGIRNELGYSAGIPVEYDYSKLGEAWSNPVILPMPYGSDRKWVAVFGAGFNGGINSNYGSAIYVVDLEDEGKVLKRIDLVDSSGNIANSVPATVTVVTPDTTSKATYKGGLVYVADLEGKLWKLNLTDQGTLYEVTQIFDGQGTQENGRMAYHQVSASVDQKGNFWTYFGTGDQQKLQRVSSQIQNRLYGIKDTRFPQFSAVTSFNVNSLINSTGSGIGSCPNDSDPGWYVNLESNEKITGKVAIYNETVFASRYTPDASDLCNPGTANLSEHDMACGNPLRNIPLGSGIATGAVIHKGTVYVGLSGPKKGSETLTEGWVREDSLIIGTPSKPVKGQESVKIESWREVF